MSKCKITFNIGSEKVVVEVDSTQLPQNLEELKNVLKNDKEAWKDAKTKVKDALIKRKKAPVLSFCFERKNDRYTLRN